MVSAILLAALPAAADPPLLRYMQCPSNVAMSLVSRARSAEWLAQEGVRRCEALIDAALDDLNATVRKDPVIARQRAAESAEQAAARRQIVAGKLRRAAKESALTAAAAMKAQLGR